MKKRIVSLLLTLCLFASLLPAPVLAAGEAVTLDIADGSIVITSTGYSVNGGTETAYTGVYTLTGTSETNTVAVESGGHAITLQDLNIPLSGREAAPFTIQTGASVVLTLKGESTLGAGAWDEYTALRLPKGASLTITAESTGSLRAEGHGYGAGIGGGLGEDAGNVAIHGGTIDASGSVGAGIGGGGSQDYRVTSGSGGHVAVTGGYVTAVSWRGAGIGGGGDDIERAGGAVGTVEISGGTVYAQGSPGIGSANGAAEGGTVSLTGGLVEARGLEGSDPIGAGTNSDVEISVSAENCVLIENDMGTVYGSTALPCDYDVLAGMTFTIPAGAVLTVPEGAALSNCGTLQNNGTLTGTGTVYGVVSGNLPDSTLTHMDAAPLVEASTEAELHTAVDKALWNVKLTRDITLTSKLQLRGKGTLEGNGCTLSITGQEYDDGVCVENGQVAVRDLTLTGGGTTVMVDRNSSAVFDNCLITGGQQGIGAEDSRVTLNDCTVTGNGDGIHGGVFVLNRSLVVGNGPYRAVSWNVFLMNSIVTGNIFLEDSEHMGAAMLNNSSVANSIILGNYDVHNGVVSAYDMFPDAESVVTDSVVGCSKDYQGNEALPETVLNSRINDGIKLSDVFAELTTVTVDGKSFTVPVVDETRRGIAAVKLTEEWTEKISAEPKVVFSVEGYHGEYSIFDTHTAYGITIISSLPYTAYFSDQEPLTAENYLKKGTTDYFSLAIDGAVEKTIYYYILRDGFPPEAGSREVVVTAKKLDYEAIDVEGRGIGFDAVNMTIGEVLPEWEYSIDGGETWRACTMESWRGECSVSDVTFEYGILLRIAENEVFYASPASPIPVARQDRPVGLTATQPNAAGDTGTISGVTDRMEYSTDDCASWTTGTGRDIGNIPQGTTVFVRTKAAGNALPSEPAAISIDSYGTAAEETPHAVIDYQSESLTGLSGEYLIHGTPYSAEGSLPIKNDWLGTGLEIVKRGDGVNTRDSLAQSLSVPARPDAPTVRAANETYPGAGDGRLSSEETSLEYLTEGAANWVAYTADARLAAGNYQVRIPATRERFASANAEVTVGSDPARQEELPQAAVSAEGNYLENLTANGTYAINGTACTADANGKIKILRSWHGTTLQIVKKGSGTSTLNSNAQYLAVPALAAAYTVIYDLNGGTGSVKDAVPYLPGDVVTVKFTPVPQMTGGAFLGWAESADAETPIYTENGTKTFTMGEEDVTLYAVWDVVKYTITWNVDGTTTTTQVAYNHLPAFNGTPEKAPTAAESFTFTGWQPGLAPAKADAAYVAQFSASPRKYTVSLNANGGTVNSGNVISYTYGAGATLPTNVTRNSCGFLGWFDNEDCTGSAVASISATDTGDKAYFAKWKIHTVPIAAIDYENETLTGLTANGNYKVDGTACTADGNGKIAIQPAWMGKAVSIVAAGNGANTLDSEAQSLVIPTRPETPTGITAEDETNARNDGKILNVTTDMEYSKDGVSWTPCFGTEITGLAGGSYKVRLKATGSGFASKAATVTVKAYQGGGFPGSGATVPTRPIISIGEGGKAEVNGATVAITPDEGYRIVEITVNGERVEIPADGKLTGLSPSATVVITFGKDTMPVFQQFTDVAAGTWYEGAVQFAVDNGLFYGTSNTTFSPNRDMTRGMLATVLYRLAKEPETTANDLFSDVAEGKYYTEAIAWAAESGIVAGYGNGRYGPEDSITREQLAVILWRYAGSPASTGSFDGFTDGAKTSDWATPALQWAVEQGIVSGKGNGVLDPTGDATRAEVAAMLMRYCKT